MRKIVLGLALAALVVPPALVSLPAQAATEGQCHAMFSKMDKSGSGSISGSRAAKYIKMMKSAHRTMDNPKRISESEFMSACLDGVFKHGY